MKILFWGERDNANLCNRIARGINRVAGPKTARVWTMQRHASGYVEDLTYVDGLGWAQSLAQDADWLITTGDGNYDVLDAMATWFLDPTPRPRIATTHTGVAFRARPALYNQLDELLGASKRFVGCDSIHLATGPAPTAPYWASCDPITPQGWIPQVQFTPNNPLRIAHSPTNRAKQGTDLILRALSEVDRRFIEIDVIENLPFVAALERRARAHVFIDQLADEVGGFGASAIEALAQGCAVLADVRNVPRRSDERWLAWGVERPPILYVRDASDLVTQIETFLREPTALYQQRCESLAWVHKYATPEAVGCYWIKQLKET